MEQIFKQTQQKMAKAIDILCEDLGTIRAGRANSSLIENIKIKAYGGTQELKLSELATIAVSDLQTMVISPFDISIIDEIERGILQANLGLSAHQDGEIIRVKIPVLNQERREEFIKLAKTKAEGVKIMIRQIRQETINNIRRKLENKEITEDEKFAKEKEIQKITDEKQKEIEEILRRKVEELSQV